MMILLIWYVLVRLCLSSTQEETLVTTAAYSTKEVNPSLAKPPLNFNGGLAKLGLTSLVASNYFTKDCQSGSNCIHHWSGAPFTNLV